MTLKIGDLISRISTGSTAFVGAGILAYAMMTGNGGGENSQKRWQEAKSRAHLLSEDRDGSSLLAQREDDLTLDQILTGSVKAGREKDDVFAAQQSGPAEESTVLSIIRENSDVSPSVSSGTDRVSVTVRAGDTLYAIATRHGLQVAELAGLNGLSEPYVIKAGQTLYVAR